MEIRGDIGAEAYVKATVKHIHITEAGVTYYVQHDGSGQLFEIKESDILFDTDPAEMLGMVKEYPAVKYETMEPPGYSVMDPELPAVKFETPEAPRRRGRPKKASVDDLMKRAEQAKIRKEIEEE